MTCRRRLSKSLLKLLRSTVWKRCAYPSTAMLCVDIDEEVQDIAQYIKKEVCYTTIQRLDSRADTHLSSTARKVRPGIALLVGISVALSPTRRSTSSTSIWGITRSYSSRHSEACARPQNANRKISRMHKTLRSSRASTGKSARGCATNRANADSHAPCLWQ